MAAATALLPRAESDRTSCRPNALVLYAGVFDLGLGDLSPLQHIRRKAPPGLVLCGEHDSLAIENRRFAQAMSDAGNRCELAMFPGAHHAFTSQLDNPVFASSLARVDQFLVSLGYIDPVGDVGQRIADLANHVPKGKRKPAKRP